MIEFALSQAGWGLLGLLIPLIVLLLSKKKQQIIEFGSLAFLYETESRTARSVFPSQWFLFLLRLLMIIILVALLAKPLFTEQATKKETFIEREVYEDVTFSPILDGIKEEPKIIDIKSSWLLIDELNHRGDSSVVYTRSYEKDFIGSANALDSKIQWNIVPLKEELITKDTLIIGNNPLRATITSDDNGVRWSSRPVEAEKKDEVITIKIVASKARTIEKNKLQSVINTYAVNLPLTFDFSESDSDYLIVIDTIAESQSEQMITWNNFNHELEIESVSEGIFQMTGNINENSISTSNFMLGLAEVFLQDKLDLKSLDKRVKYDVPILKADASVNLKEREKLEKRWYWISALFALLLLERWYAKKLVAG